MSVPSTFFGDDYSPKIDKQRLVTQFEAIIAYMSDGQWHTMHRMAEDLQVKYNKFFPHGSIGSQIRNARLLGYSIEKQRTHATSGLYEYRLVNKSEPAPASLVV